MEYLKKGRIRPAQEEEERSRQVAEIIHNIRKSGDEAILEYNTRFDGNPRGEFRVVQREIDEAYAKMSEQELEDLRQAAGNIRAFAEAQRDCLKNLEGFSAIPNSCLGHRVIPVSSCGCYVPGGSYPLFSTALMLIIPAKAAGVRRVIACAPAVKGTEKIHYKTLVAMDIAGADEIYVVGGAQAIAAFAYGTEQIKPVDVIVGPGNQYVAEAKRQCYGQVGIDFFAGPSEVLALADESANPNILAADMLAQAEHDRLAKSILVTTSKKLGLEVIECVRKQLKTLETAEIASESWESYGEVVLADSLQEAVALVNDYAPEHLEVILKDESILPELTKLRLSFYRSGDRRSVRRLCVRYQPHAAYSEGCPLYRRSLGRNFLKSVYISALSARRYERNCAACITHGTRGRTCSTCKSCRNQAGTPVNLLN